MGFSMLAEIRVFEPQDLSAALQQVFPETADAVATGERHAIATLAIDAAARAQLKRLAAPQITELEQIRRDIRAIAQLTRAIVDTLEPQLTESHEVMPVSRVTAARVPASAVVSAIESGARAGGFDAPTEALNDAVVQVSNLHLWAQAAAAAFEAGQCAKESAELRSRDDVVRRSPLGAALLAATGEDGLTSHSQTRADRRGAKPAHAGRDLGFVVMVAYEALTGWPVRVSRRNATKSQAGGEVTGPLVRFVAAVFARIRLGLARDRTLKPFQIHRSFNPTPATIAAWAREYNLRES